MTYKQLLDKLNTIDHERLNDTVTVWDYWQNEFTPVANLVENKFLSHFVLELKN